MFRTGEHLWEQQRSAWRTVPPNYKRPLRRPVLSPDITYEDILLTSRPFPKPVPLQEMVDMLVDTWDEDGLYDSTF